MSRNQWKKLTALHMADVIERFLNGQSLYPQEWNDFIESPQFDRDLDAFRKRCFDLDPFVNGEGEVDCEAERELAVIVHQLRDRPHKADR